MDDSFFDDTMERSDEGYEPSSICEYEHSTPHRSQMDVMDATFDTTADESDFEEYSTFDSGCYDTCELDDTAGSDGLDWDVSSIHGGDTTCEDDEVFEDNDESSYYLEYDPNRLGFPPLNQHYCPRHADIPDREIDDIRASRAHRCMDCMNPARNQQVCDEPAEEEECDEPEYQDESYYEEGDQEECDEAADGEEYDDYGYEPEEYGPEGHPATPQSRRRLMDIAVLREPCLQQRFGQYADRGPRGMDLGNYPQAPVYQQLAQPSQNLVIPAVPMGRSLGPRVSQLAAIFSQHTTPPKYMQARDPHDNYCPPQTFYRRVAHPHAPPPRRLALNDTNDADYC